MEIKIIKEEKIISGIVQISYNSQEELDKIYSLIIPDYSKYSLKLNSEGLYDCEGHFKVPSELVENGKFKIKFGTITGWFDCSYKELISLEGCPKTVGYFNCSNNKLTSLKGSPKTVGGYFNCSHNKLNSLEGSPKTVGGWFDCSCNELKSLKGSPKTVSYSFYCDYNELVPLEGGPETVGGFWCSNNDKKFSEKEVRSICKVKNEMNILQEHKLMFL